MGRAAALVLVLIGSILSLSFAGPVFAEQLDDAFSAYKRGDYGTAYRLFRTPADQGNPVAQVSLGDMYYHGKGVPLDYAEAMKWYRKAANQELADAQFNLGIMYHNGDGVPKDYVLSYMWLNLASSRYTSTEADKRERAKKYRDDMALSMTRDQVAEAQKLTREWKPKKEK